MTLLGKTVLAALAAATVGFAVPAPAEARTDVYIGFSYGSGGYYGPRYGYGYDYRYRDWDRHRWERDRHWRRHHYRDQWRGRPYDRRYWRGRDRCWVEWYPDRWGRGRVPVQVCR